MAKIDTIHFLVYPQFFRDRARHKEAFWENNIREMAGKKNSLFVMLRRGRRKSRLERRLIGAGRVLGDRFIYGRALGTILRKIKNSHTFAREVWITAYGQHAGECVTDQREDFGKALKGEFQWVEFISREHRGLSAKTRESLVKAALERHRPDLVKKIDDNEMWRLKSAYEDRKFSTGEFRNAIRRARNANEFFGMLHVERDFFRRSSSLREWVRSKFRRLFRR